MAQAFVQVGVQVVAQVAILVYQPKRVSVDDKLIVEAVSFSRLVVSVGQVANGDALASVLRPYPIGIGQIDAYGCRRIFVAPEHCRTDNVGSDSLYLGLAETGIHRRVVFKPLGILADGAGALGGLFILVFHNTFPRAFYSQRVAIHLYKAVYEINLTVERLDPKYGILVKDM